MHGNFSSFGPQKAVKTSKTTENSTKMTISSQIPGACKTGSSERIQKYNRVHLPVPHRSIVSKFGVSTFRPHPNARDQKKSGHYQNHRGKRLGPFGPSTLCSTNLVTCLAGQNFKGLSFD